MAEFGEVEAGWTREMWIEELKRNATCWERGATYYDKARGDELRRRARVLRDWAKTLENDSEG